MATAIKVLANGQLASSIGDLYTVPASTSTIIKTITCVNTNTTDETINVYVTPSAGTARRIIHGVLLANLGSMVCDSEITLATGDKLRADTTTASKVDYIVAGVEVT